MPATVTLKLTDAQRTALAWEAEAFKTSIEDRLLMWLRPSLEDCCRRYDDTQWHTRRHTLEMDAKLAALVDRAGDW